MAALEEAEGIAAELFRPAFVVNALCHVGPRAGGCVRHAALGSGIASRGIGWAGDISDRSLRERDHFLYPRAGDTLHKDGARNYGRRRWNGPRLPRYRHFLSADHVRGILAAGIEHFAARRSRRLAAHRRRAASQALSCWGF